MLAVLGQRKGWAEFTSASKPQDNMVIQEQGSHKNVAYIEKNQFK